MNLNKFVNGKITLNEYVHRVNHNDVSFQVHYWGVMPKHYDTSLHKHSFFEVCYVVRGEGTYIDEGRTYKLQKNTLFLSKPEVLHQIKSKVGLFLLYVAFDLIENDSSREWVRIFETVKKNQVVVLNEKEETTTTLLWKSLLIQALRYKEAFSGDLLNSMAYSLILSIMQSFAPSLSHSNQKQVTEGTSSIFNQAKLYIDDNLSSPLKLTEVANHLYISGRHLSRIFVSELGVSYSKYVQDQRIKKATLLLKTSHLSIKEISEETGFISVQYFTRVFTSKMQCTPGRFRSLYMDSRTIRFSKG
jgi:AraC family transcriptional regulator, arabinose operon regulatory protein